MLTDMNCTTYLTVRHLAVGLFRLSTVLGRRFGPLGFLVKQLNHVLTGADIAWQADIGPGLRLYHPTGVVIGPHVRIGRNCTLQQGVTVGGKGGETAQVGDSPAIGDDVSIGAGAKLFGGVQIGDRARIGANAVVLKSVPPDHTAVGVPARISLTSGESPAALEHRTDP